MRELMRVHRGSAEKIIAAYALAERAGEVIRSSNTYKITSENYATRLFNDGIKKGWING
ncbi:MAG: hypothetical protein RLZZ505_2486 [Verrucomicrobiota bacterium]